MSGEVGTRGAVASPAGGNPELGVPEGTPEMPSTQLDADAATDEDEDGASGEATRAVGDGVWGRLLSARDSSARLLLRTDAPPYTIGRGPACALRLDDAHVSTLHARLSLGAGGATLEDCSTNGVWVNGAKLDKGATRALVHLDELAFVSPTAKLVDATAYSFILFAPAASREAAGAGAVTAGAVAAPAVRTPPVEGAAAEGAAAEGAATEGAAAEGAAAEGAAAEGAPALDTGVAGPPAAPDSAVERELICCICQDLMHRPVALQPCLHAACGACFSEWMRRKLECPQCRQPVRVVSRNHTLANIIDGFLAQRPDRRREPAELARMDAEDQLGNEPRAVRKRAHADGADLGELSDDDEGSGSSGEDSDPDGPPLDPQLLAALAAAHAPAPCRVCSSLVPSASMQPLDLHASGGPLRTLPSGALGNGHERSVLLAYLSARGISVAEMFADCLRRLRAGEMQLPAPHLAPGQDANTELTRPACRTCLNKFYATLAYKYRAAIPASELPEEVTRRSDCWYGTSCRTQRHNLQHSQRLNHICSPTRGNGSSGAHG
jgi:E3 ubiquitin-protein ligase CHFR